MTISDDILVKLAQLFKIDHKDLLGAASIIKTIYDPDGADLSNILRLITELMSPTFLQDHIIDPIKDYFSDEIVTPITTWINSNLITLISAWFLDTVYDEIIEPISSWINLNLGGILDTWLSAGKNSILATLFQPIINGFANITIGTFDGDD